MKFSPIYISPIKASHKCILHKVYTAINIWRPYKSIISHFFKILCRLWSIGPASTPFRCSVQKLVGMTFSAVSKISSNVKNRMKQTFRNNFVICHKHIRLASATNIAPLKPKHASVSRRKRYINVDAFFASAVIVTSIWPSAWPATFLAL